MPDFWIDGQLVKPQSNEVFLEGRVVQLEHKAMQVLLCLAKQSGVLVSREALMEEVWQDSLVTEETLSRCVSLLRKVFKDDAHHPRVIQTIRKKGYRLIATVSLAQEQSYRPLKKQQKRKQINPLKIIGYSLGLVFLIFILGVIENPNGKDVVVWKTVPVTSGKGIESQPDISPDGSRVAYYKYTDQKSEGDIYLTIPGGDEPPKQLTKLPGHEISPVWSPDSKWIAFQNVTTQKRRLYIISAIGGAPRLVGHPNEVLFENINWLPEGKGLAYIDRDNTEESYGIYFLDISSGKTKRMTYATNQHWGDYYPAFSSDGKRMSFIRGVSAGTHDLFIMNLETMQERRLNTNTRRALGQIWNPLEEKIIYAAFEGYRGILWQITTNEPNGIRQAQAMNLWGENPSIDASGKLIVVEDLSFDYDIQMLSSDAEGNDFKLTKVKGLNSTLEDFAPSFSPDGGQLIFVSNRSGNYELWLMDWYHKQVKKLTSFAGPYLSAPAWAPNGQEVLFNVFTKSGNADIYRLQLSTLLVQPLLQTKNNEIAPCWSADGQGFYYGCNETGTWQIWKYQFEDKTSVPVTTNGGYRVLTSKEETHLYFSKFDEPGIWEISLRDGSTAQLLEQVHLYDWGNWILDDTYLYYTERASPFKPVWLKKYNLITQENDSLIMLKDTPSLPGLAQHPISGDLLITQTLHKECDIVMHILVD